MPDGSRHSNYRDFVVMVAWIHSTASYLLFIILNLKLLLLTIHYEVLTLHSQQLNYYDVCNVKSWCCQTIVQWIGLRENLQESPIFHGKIYGFLSISPPRRGRFCWRKAYTPAPKLRLGTLRAWDRSESDVQNPTLTKLLRPIKIY